MKFTLKDWSPRLSGLVLAGVAVGAGAAPMPAPNISLRNEVRHAIDRGCAALEKMQNTNGFWTMADQPAITALVLTALEGPSPKQPESAAVEKGFAYVMGCAQPDGGFYRKDLPSYNTAVVLTALAVRNRPEDKGVIQRARKFLIGLQITGDPADTNNAFAGGIGYGGVEKMPDLSDTVMALEALYNTRQMVKDEAGAPVADLNWKAAIQFVQNCQNLPGTNAQGWASDDPQNKGGFVYAPGRSMAGQTTNAAGRVALRSYGSMSYAGLLSYIYEDIKPSDPRVTAALDWIRGNYTVDENPALGPQGIYYYYVLMAKALTFAGVDTLETKDGRKVNWREDLALKLINLQHADGSWVNDNGRWWEKDPALDTAFGVITMEVIADKL